MADIIGVVVEGDRKVALRFEEFPKKLHDRLLPRITALTQTLLARVRADAPDRTGKLKGEIVSQIFDDPQKKITGRISVDAEHAKAGALEYGAHSTQRVSAHPAHLDHAWGKKIANPTTVMVGAYSRRLNIAARKFMRGPLAQMEPQIKAGLQQAVTDTVEE